MSTKSEKILNKIKENTFIGENEQVYVQYHRNATGSFTMPDNIAPHGWYMCHSVFQQVGYNCDQKRGRYLGKNVKEALKNT